MIQTRLSLAIAAGLFSSLTPLAAIAQATQSNHSATEEPIERMVITSTRTEQPWLRTPASVDQVDTADQLPGLRVDAAEILAGIPGIQTDTRYNFAQDTRIILRGFGARAAFGVRGVVMRLDGIPLSMPDGQAQTSSIFVDEPARAEVLRGPIAGVYGNAAGGIINMDSQRPQQSHVGVGHAIGANHRERTTLDGHWVTDDLALSFHYARFRTDGDRPQSAAERDQYAGRFYYNLPHQIELILRVDDNDSPLLEDPGSLTPEQWREDPEQTFGGAGVFNTRKHIRHRQQSLTLRQDTGYQSWQLAAWNGTREVEQYLPFPGDDITSSGAVIDLTRDFYGIHGQFNWLPLQQNPDWQLSVGVDLERQKDTRLGFVNNQGTAGDLRRDETGRVDKNDIYALSTLQLTDRLNWLAGIRISALDFTVDDRYIIEGVIPDDSGATDYTETSWTTGFSYAITNQWSSFISAGQGFETPTLTELAYRNDGTGLNPELSPAYIDQLEAGVKWAGYNGQAQLSLFEVRTDDEIVVDQSIDGRTTYRNAAQTRRQGIELSYLYQLHPAWNVRGAATVMKARYRSGELDERRIPGIATSNLFMQVNFLPWHDDRLRAAVTGQYRSRIATNDDNDVFAPGFTLWHASVEARQYHDQWLFSQWVRVDNLLDKTYVSSVVVNQASGRAFEPAPGRQLSAGVRVERRF